MEISTTRARPMTLTIGAEAVIATMMNRNRRVTSRATSSATKTWTTTVSGARTRATAMSGCPRGLLPAGLPIAMAIGPGFLRGAGLGSMTRRGVTHRSTTAVGYLSAETGVGCPDRGKSSPCMRPRWWSLLVDRSSASRLHEAETVTVAMWGGSRWAQEKFMYPGITPAVGT